MAITSPWLLLKSALRMTSFLCRSAEGNRRKSRPNILLVVVDDLGFGDLGSYDSNMFTPTLNKLYNEGFRLNYSYTDPVGSSSRASLLSGIYSFKMGLQGFCSQDQTPLYRGFDSFFGQYTSKTDYVTMKTEEGFLDIRDNEEVMSDRRFRNLYSTEVWSKRTIKEINTQKKIYPKKQSPFFIMTAFTAIQSPNDVPDKYIQKCRKGLFTSDIRKQKCGMMAALDQAIFRIMRALKKTKQDENTVVIFTSDNGGDVEQGSSNWPLRGNIGTVWEGGIRVPSFLWSSTLLPKKNHIYTGAFHVVDWYPTIVGFARTAGKPNWPRKIMPKVDGVNFWRLIKRGVRKSFRTEFAYLVEEDNKSVAYVRLGDFKIVVNEQNFPGWYSPPIGFNATDLQEPEMNWNRKPFLLFNIRKDPSETRDLSKSNVPKNAEARDSLQLLYDSFKVDYVSKVVDYVNSSPASHPEHNDVWSYGSC